MVNCNNQCGWLQLSMRLDNSKMSFFSMFSLAGKTSGFKRPGSTCPGAIRLPATGYRLPCCRVPRRTMYHPPHPHVSRYRLPWTSGSQGGGGDMRYAPASSE